LSSACYSAPPFSWEKEHFSGSVFAVVDGNDDGVNIWSLTLREKNG